MTTQWDDYFKSLNLWSFSSDDLWPFRRYAIQFRILFNGTNDHWITTSLSESNSCMTLVINSWILDSNLVNPKDHWGCSRTRLQYGEWPLTNRDSLDSCRRITKDLFRIPPFYGDQIVENQVKHENFCVWINDRMYQNSDDIGLLGFTWTSHGHLKRA